MTADTDTGSLATFPGRDGLELVYRSIGEGRPFVLLHGFTSSGLQFLQHGLADALAGRGYRVIAPDLRGHGDSPRPHDPAAYPPDVLADDGLAPHRGKRTVAGAAGDYVTIPPERHSLDALEDAAVLLTVVMPR